MSAPPTDVEAERAVLAAILLDSGEAWPIAAETLTAEHFWREQHRHLYRAMFAASRGGDSFDEESIRGELRRAGQLTDAIGEELTGMLNTIPDIRALSNHCELVRNLASARDVCGALAAHLHRGQGAIGDVREFLDDTEKAVSRAAEGGTGRAGLIDAHSAVSQAYGALVARAGLGGGLEGMPSGLVALDRAISGWAPGRMYVIAGRPGMGKTVLGACVAAGIAKAGGTVGVFSLEMPTSEYMGRILVAEAGVDARAYREARLDRDSMQRLTHDAGRVAEWPIHINDTPALTVPEIARAARKLHRKTEGGLKAIIVDYLQLVGTERGAPDSREQQVAQQSKAFKVLAKELGCAVVVLAQLNRGVESRQDKRPHISDLRESGAIEQDADTVVLLYRDDAYNPGSAEAGTVEAIVGKQRAGETGMIKLGWQGQHQRITNLEQYHDDEAPL